MIEHGRELAFLLAIANNTTSTYFDVKPSVDSFYVGSRSINDGTALSLINTAMNCPAAHTQIFTNAKSTLAKFETMFMPWISSHSSNSILGLESFIPSMSAGTTQAFDHFYVRYKNRKFKCLVGEYFYHLKVWNNTTDWSFIYSTDDLAPGDAFVISTPFCDTGNMHPDYNKLMERCCELDIPVLVDCCYFTISGNVTIDVSYPCIDSVAFSLSKAFPVANLRIGVRYSRSHVYDGMNLHSSIGYNNSASAYVGLSIISQLPCDYIYNSYREKQLDVCKLLNISPSNSVIFGVGDDSWNQYSRRSLLDTYGLQFDPTNFKNRICLSSVFDNWNLYTGYKNAA